MIDDPVGDTTVLLLLVISDLQSPVMTSHSAGDLLVTVMITFGYPGVGDWYCPVVVVPVIVGI